MYLRFFCLTILFFESACTKTFKGFTPGSRSTESGNANPQDSGLNEGSKGAESEKEEEFNYEALPLISRAVTDHDFFTEVREGKVEHMKEGEEQMKALCGRNQGKPNRVIQAFCVENIRPKSLIELQNALGLNVVANNVPFTFTGHSSSLVAKFTSQINPRAIIFTSNGQDLNYVVMGFVRGEQFVELIANNGQPNTPDYFLVAFKQACNSEPEGCSVGDLLTPAIESNWTSFTIYQDDDLKNTIVDCKHCHQPEGVNSPKILRMQELQNPWTHFFRNNRVGGQALLADYYAAHGQDEVYAGVPGPIISNSDPADLEDFVRDNGFATQPNEFPTQTIENEIEASSTTVQPADNTDPGASDSWEQIYQAHVRGEVIAVPYHNVKVTDPALLTKFTQQYQAFLAGTITADQMEDHREIFKTDPMEKAAMGFAVRPGESGQTIITQACAQCHNSKLDQDLSRANFNVDLAAMGPKAKSIIDVAIQRLTLGYTPERLAKEKIKFFASNGEEKQLAKGEHLLTMPPRRFKDLTDEQIDAAIQYLEQAKSQLP